MDLLRISDQTTWKPDILIEGWNSLIWTERFVEPGDFELRTPLVEQTMQALPLNSLLTLRESREVMLVETHTIKTNDAGVAELTVVGRTFDSILESRILRGGYQAPTATVVQLTPAQYAACFLWNELVNTQSTDFLRHFSTAMRDSNIPYVSVGMSDEAYAMTGNAQTWWVEEGEMASQFRDISKDTKVGVRAKRPPTAHSRLILYNGAGGMLLGTYTEDITTLLLEVYSGADRTVNSITKTPVVFAMNMGNLDNPQYLFSQKDYRNVAYIDSKLGAAQVYATPADANTTSLNRRVLYVDGSDVDSTDKTYEQILPALQQKARQELLNHNMQFLFDVAVANTDPYKYGTDYDLGDLITLNADYGISRTMRVTEFVRSQDNNGEKSYPTLTQI